MLIAITEVDVCQGVRLQTGHCKFYSRDKSEKKRQKKADKGELCGR